MSQCLTNRIKPPASLTNKRTFMNISIYYNYNIILINNNNNRFL